MELQKAHALSVLSVNGFDRVDPVNSCLYIVARNQSAFSTFAIF